MWSISVCEPPRILRPRTDRSGSGTTFSALSGVEAFATGRPEPSVVTVALSDRTEVWRRSSWCPRSSARPAIVAEYKSDTGRRKRQRTQAGTLVTQPDIIHPVSVRLPHTVPDKLFDEPRYCPQYRVGTPHKIRLTLVNRDPTILIKAENSYRSRRGSRRAS